MSRAGAGSLLVKTAKALYPWPVVAGDTHPDAARILRERIRRMSPAERVAEGARAAKLAREVMRAGIRKRHPYYTAEQLEEALARLLWGDDLYRRARPGWELLEP